MSKVGSVVLAIVVLTFQERELYPQASRDAGSAGIDLEMVVVDDDPPDETSLVARETARRYAHVRVIHRRRRR